MTEFLTFAMIAPMASFGSVAAGEQRDSWDRPARSAVLGLVAACLGLERDDETAQTNLADYYGLAMLCRGVGFPLRDYHTAQMVSAPRKRFYYTRAEALSADSARIDTFLSQREYRMGGWHLGCLWIKNAEEALWSLSRVKEAMEKPIFTLSMGRKSCPLALPLSPQVIVETDVINALKNRYETGLEGQFNDKTPHLRKFCDEILSDGRGTKRWEMPLPWKNEAERQGMIIVMDQNDVPDTLSSDYKISQIRTETRRDQPLSRQKWHFGLRKETILAFTGE